MQKLTTVAVQARTKQCTKPKAPATKARPPEARAAASGVACFAVKASRGNTQRGKRGRSQQRQSHERQRISGTLQQKRIRKILEGQMSPAEALALMFSSPSLWLPQATSDNDFLVELPLSHASLLSSEGFLLAN